jgi:NAD(P)H-quinone oxidoreductase subunit 1
MYGGIDLQRSLIEILTGLGLPADVAKVIWKLMLKIPHT